MVNYFESCTDAASIKRKYIELAKKHHPDKGGDTRTMQEINSQYQTKLKFSKVKPGKVSGDDDFETNFRRSTYGDSGTKKTAAGGFGFSDKTKGTDFYKCCKCAKYRNKIFADMGGGQYMCEDCYRADMGGSTFTRDKSAEEKREQTDRLRRAAAAAGAGGNFDPGDSFWDFVFKSAGMGDYAEWQKQHMNSQRTARERDNRRYEDDAIKNAREAMYKLRVQERAPSELVKIIEDLLATLWKVENPYKSWR